MVPLFPQSRFMGPGSYQGVKMGEALLLCTSSGPLAKFLFPIHEALCSDCLEASVPKGGILPLGEATAIPLK